jgi:acetoin utilization deacetylase AcuC-like enzyme
LNKIKNSWIIDVDAHKGDGSAELTANNPYISTLSIHMKNGWPLVTGPLDSDKKLYPWYIPSTIDIEMEMGQEAQYLERLQSGLEQLKAATARPDMAVVVQGADPYELDELPSSSKLNLTLAQMLQRDQLVANFLAREGIPALYLMGGGYGVHSHEPYVQFLNKVFDK